MITFSYPAYDTLIESLTMKDPQKGDGIETRNELKVHMSQNGTMRTLVKKKDGVNSQLNFQGLCTIDEYRQFFLRAQGHYVKYTDYNNENWVFLVTSDTFSSMREVSGYSFTLEITRWPL